MPGENHKDRWKERVADEIVRRIRRRLLGFLARWKLWKSPLTFATPSINSEKGTTVKVFDIVVHDREKFVETYLKLLEAMQQHRRYADFSRADAYLDQSPTKARNTAERRTATTEFTLNLHASAVDASAVDAGTGVYLLDPVSSEFGGRKSFERPTVDVAGPAQSLEAQLIECAEMPAAAISVGDPTETRARRVTQGQGFSLDWD